MRSGIAGGIWGSRLVSGLDMSGDPKPSSLTLETQSPNLGHIGSRVLASRRSEV